jgi:hypothetical protein
MKRKIKWIRHVARVRKRREEVRNRYYWENLKKRFHFEDLEEERETILNWINMVPGRGN